MLGTPAPRRRGSPFRAFLLWGAGHRARGCFRPDHTSGGANLSIHPLPWSRWLTATGSGSNRISGSILTRPTRSESFCAYTILGVELHGRAGCTRLDERFADHPLVVGEPFIRFYAGAPLITPRGFRLGTLCISDMVAREFGSREEVAMLEELAAIVGRRTGTALGRYAQSARSRTPTPRGPVLIARRPR